MNLYSLQRASYLLTVITNLQETGDKVSKVAATSKKSKHAGGKKK